MQLLPNQREHLSSAYGADNGELLVLLVESYAKLVESSPFDRSKPEKLIRRFMASLVFDFRGTIAKLSTLADSLLATLVSTSEHTVTGEFLYEMTDTPIFREYHHFYKTGDASALKYVLTFLTFAKKADVDFSDLESVAFHDWLSIEKEMETLKFDDAHLALLKKAIGVLVDVDKFDDTVLIPKHGNGQVAEQLDGLPEKVRTLTADSKLLYCFRQARFGRRLDQGSLPPKGNRKKRSRLRFVRKSYKTYRSICMEPAAYMFFQQEVMRWLVNMINDSPIGRIVDLTDQALNREYALNGSYHQGVDTIDLSAASDRVHIDIVRAVFPPKVLYYLLGTRSDSVLLPDGSTVQLKKFAPMGSALCFPVQCILFAAITMIGYTLYREACTLDELANDEFAEVKLRRNLSLSRDSETSYGRLINPRVYGDDIICDTRVTDHVTQLLTIFGLKVNTSKSFTGGQMVRESCGIYAYNGYDITPYMFRISRFQKNLGASAYMSWIDAINNCGDHGYRELHSFLINRLREKVSHRAPLPFVVKRDLTGIYTRNKIMPDPRFMREHKHYQRDEEFVLLTRTKGSSLICQDDESYLYSLWQRSKLRPPRPDAFVQPVGRSFPRYVGLSGIWTPLIT